MSYSTKEYFYTINNYLLFRIYCKKRLTLQELDKMILFL